MSLHNANIAEPIAGYTLRERIGAGGYGEVWKADAPGGLVKAVKLVYGYLNEERATTELKAFNRIKQVRHPFLLSLERIEIVEGQLVIVTELADSSLKDWYEECRKAAMPGIPRDELIGYLRDAADALDYMSQHFSLQHLDVKPENLLLVAGHIKVGDFGLVKDLRDGTASLMQGMTPIYAPPEVFDGRATTQSDQYSLAIVYQEMLTGQLPFPGRTLAQLAAQHLHSPPRLNTLPTADRAIIGRALSKEPQGRFKDCREMIESLWNAGRVQLYGPAPGAALPTAAESEIDTKSILTKATAVIDAARAEKGAADATQPGWPGGVAAESAAPVAPASAPAFQAPVRGDAAPREVIETAAEGTFEDLPPLEATSAPARLRPTLIVGVGGAAARMLSRLRSRLEGRLGKLDTKSAIQLLLFDTDNEATNNLVRHDAGPSLAAHEVLPIPLRRTQDYRANSKRFLQWLSRRWLYNIPRSQQTEGLRPLGRLAFVDHYESIARRLNAAIEAMLRPAAVEALAEASGYQVAADEPRVVIVASLSGGTGSGMAFDVAYAVRKLLADRHLTDRYVTGMLMHATDWHAADRELAVTNTYGALAELYHYSRDGGRYPGDSICGLPPRKEDGAPFADTYFVHLGDDLSQEQFESQLDKVAEYVYRDTATSAASMLDACRQAALRKSNRHQSDVLVRTFGIATCRAAAEDVTNAIESVCREAIATLLGPVEAVAAAASSAWTRRGREESSAAKAMNELSALLKTRRETDAPIAATATARPVADAIATRLADWTEQLVSKFRPPVVEPEPLGDSPIDAEIVPDGDLNRGPATSNASTNASAGPTNSLPVAAGANAAAGNTTAANSTAPAGFAPPVGFAARRPQYVDYTPMLVAELFAAAEALVVGDVRAFDLAELIRSPLPDEEALAPLAHWLQRAAPHLPDGSAARRLIVCVPTGSSGAALQESLANDAHVASNLTIDADAGLTLIYETEQVSLPQLAAALTGYRPEYADVANRLHTRIDIEWTPLPDVRRVEDKDKLSAEELPEGQAT